MMTLKEFTAEWYNDSPQLLVHTSGSTGKPKPLWVEKRRMMASARITCDFLGLREGDSALLCMSLDYIAGKMMVVRALERKLSLYAVPPSGHPLSDASLLALEGPSGNHAKKDAFDFVAMVPLQVYNSLQVPAERERLQQIQHLIIGGGAIDDGLAAELKDFPHAVWSTYGMTETLSHIALRRLNGPDASDWYMPFTGVDVSSSPDGCLIIRAPQVCDGPLLTNDIAEIHDGKFRIIGRKDNVICSGGIKIQIEEVERKLRPHFAKPFAISRRPDERLGEAVVLLTEDTNLEALASVCRQVLPKYWQPRFFMHIDQLPVTETGKPARKVIELMILANCEFVSKN